MKKTGSGLGLAIGVLVWCGGMLLSGDSSATLPIQKQAKEAGIPATNCLYCHGEKLPKKILYIHCKSGKRALTAASMLRKQGYDARALKAGFDDLRQAGFTVAK